MELLNQLPVSVLAVTVFFCRIVDVSISTMRTMAIVQGRTVVAAGLGFAEVVIWLSMAAQVISRVNQSPFLIIFFAGGFAAGNGVGIWLEKKLAFGEASVRIMSSTHGEAIATALRQQGYDVAAFCGEGKQGPLVLLYVDCARRAVPEVLAHARAIDPHITSMSERANMLRLDHRPVSDGRRAALEGHSG